MFVGVSNDGEAFGLTLDEIDKIKTKEGMRKCNRLEFGFFRT